MFLSNTSARISAFDANLGSISYARKAKPSSHRSSDQDDSIDRGSLSLSHLSPTNRSSDQSTQQLSEAWAKLDELRIQQTMLEDRLKQIGDERVHHDLLNSYRNQMQEFRPLLTHVTHLNELKATHSRDEAYLDESLKFFRLFMWRLCVDRHNWKVLAHSIYRIDRFITSLDNYQIREFLEKPFKSLLDEFITWIKHVIRTRVKDDRRTNGSHGRFVLQGDRAPKIEYESHSSLDTLPSDEPTDETMDRDLQNLRDHAKNLRALVLTVSERFTVCRTETDALRVLIQLIDDLPFDARTFDEQDQAKMRLLTLREEISTKSTKADFKQLKIYLDQQIKRLIELNKANARTLEDIKRMKRGSCEIQQIQSILSSRSSLGERQQRRMPSYQSSRPFITFDLDHIRKYQRQAMMHSSHGTIPLYRRQAWVKLVECHERDRKSVV